MEFGMVREIRSVEELGLVTMKPRVSSILRNYDVKIDRMERRRSAMTMGYVTPWNPRGYEYAERYACKLDVISPVWFTMTADAGKREVMVQGSDEVRMDWVDRVRAAGLSEECSAPHELQVMPRVIAEGRESRDFEFLFSEVGSESSTKVLISLLDRFGLDGVVLEMRTLMTEAPLRAVRRMTAMFHDRGYKVGLVLSADNGPLVNKNPAHFAEIDFLNVLLYDFSMSRNKVGPNAPISWVRTVVAQFMQPPVVDVGLAPRILFGLPFYGFAESSSHGSKPVFGDALIDLLRKHRPRLYWDEDSHENYFDFPTSDDENDDDHYRLFFPTLYFLRERLDIFSRAGAGVGIWELGQGNPYFYDLF